MSTGQVLTVVGYAVGTYFGYPQLGAIVGGLVGSAIDASNVEYDVPKVGDLKAPQMQYGARLPRLYGSNRTSATLAWFSDKRIVPGDSGGKGEPDAPTADTADIDVLYLFSVDSPIIAIARVWRNGEVIWTNHAGSDSTSVAVSGSTEAWTSMDFLDGNPDQLPHPTIEAADGVGNVSAYRHRQGAMITGLHLGQSGQLPLIEFEVITHGTVTDAADLFADLPTPDEAYIGLGTPAFSGLGFTHWIGQWDNTYSNNNCIVYNIAADGSYSQAAIVELQSNIVSGFGNSDESGLMNASASPWETIYWTWSTSGFYAEFFLPTGAGMASGQRFSKVGDDFVFVGQQSGFGLKKVYRFTRTNPAVQAESVALDTVSGCTGYCSSIAIGDGKVYALDTGGALIIRLDLSTLAVEATFATPSTYAHAAVVCDEDGVLHFADGVTGIVSSWDGDTWTTVFSGVAEVIGNSLQCSYGMRGGIFYATGGAAATYAPDDRVYVRRVMHSIDPEPIMLDEIVSAEWERVGEASQIDVTALASIPVLGFQSGGSVRAANEALAAIFHFGAACSNKLYYRLMGGAVVATPGFDELAAGEDKPTEEPFVPERGNEDEIPERILLTCPDYNNDYNTTTQTGNRGTGTSSVEQSATTNVVMTPAECKEVAEIAAALAGISATTGQIALTDYYAPLEPTDPIIVPDEDGNLYRVRIARDTYGGGVHQLDWVLDDPNALIATGITSDIGTQALTVLPPAVTELLFVDTALWRDVDDNPGFYVAAKGSLHGSKLYGSLDGVDYTELATFNTQAVFGRCATTFNDWSGGFGFDEASSLTVDVGDGTLSSTTSATLITDRTLNACAIGVDGHWELCQFRTATLVSTGIYTLTGFLRGMNGTEWASTGHVANESFLLINTAARRIDKQASEIGTAEYYKGVSAGRLLSSATAQVFTDNAVGLEPYAVVDLRMEEIAGTITFYWNRRSRLAFRFLATGIEPPLAETSESYDVELRNASDVLVESDTVTSAAWATSSLTDNGEFTYSLRDIKVVGGDAVGIDILSERQTSTGQVHMVQADDATGTLILVSSDYLGNYCHQWTYDGDEIYVATGEYNAVSGTNRNSFVHRLTRDVLDIEATYTAGTPGDVLGIASDGTDVWISEYISGNIRKLNPSTLASVATYALEAGLGRMQYDSGSLWVLNYDTQELIEWDIGTTAELRRFTVSASDFLIVGNLIFAIGADLVVYNKTTEAVVNTVTHVNALPMCVFGSYVVIGDSWVPGTLRLIDSTTGLLTRTIDASALGYYTDAMGASGSTLFVTGYEASGNPIATHLVALSSPDLAGYSLTVWQRSSVVGRGYPTTLEL